MLFLMYLMSSRLVVMEIRANSVTNTISWVFDTIYGNFKVIHMYFFQNRKVEMLRWHFTIYM